MALQVTADTIDDGTVATTVAELPLGIVFDPETDGQLQLVHGLQVKANVVETDIMASNGVIHVIDKVLTYPVQTIPELAGVVPELAKLEEALTTEGLVPALSGAGPFTVFAPVNGAFDALPEELPAALSDILTYHVSSGEVRARRQLVLAPLQKLTRLAAF